MFWKLFICIIFFWFEQHLHHVFSCQTFKNLEKFSFLGSFFFRATQSFSSMRRFPPEELRPLLLGKLLPFSRGFLQYCVRKTIKIFFLLGVILQLWQQLFSVLPKSPCADVHERLVPVEHARESSVFQTPCKQQRILTAPTIPWNLCWGN